MKYSFQDLHCGIVQKTNDYNEFKKNKKRKRTRKAVQSAIAMIQKLQENPHPTTLQAI